jgi:hypothetical protein
MLLWGMGLGGFGGLTCDFWAENAENKCKYNKQQQIPFGDGNKNGNSGDQMIDWVAEEWGLVRRVSAIPPIANCTMDGAPGR